MKQISIERNWINRTYRGLSSILGIVLMLGLLVSNVYGLTYNKFETSPSGSVGNWHNAANWSLGVLPTTNNYVSFKSAGIGVVTQVEEKVYSAFIGQSETSKLTVESNGGLSTKAYFYVGYSTGGTGTVIQNGGDLNVGTSFKCGVLGGGFGVYTQMDGTVSCGDFSLGYDTGSTGSYTIVDGALDVRFPAGGYIGFGGDGTMNQVGGDVTLGKSFTLGKDANATGIFNLSGGSLDIASQLILGRNVDSTGIINQSGGTNTVKSIGNLYISLYGTGEYNLTGGALHLKRDSSDYSIYIGHTGDGVLNMGDASGSGSIDVVGSESGNISLVVRGSAAGASGVIHGWGGMHLPGAITMNGSVIADGYGTDRTLWMTNSSRIAQTLDNAVDDTNGWYAVDHGKLVLPTLPNVSAPGVYYWGEESDLDLVNSVKIQGYSGAGPISGALLASDRTDVASNMLAVGVWEFSNPGAGSLSSVNLTFVFDHVKAAELGIAEADLKVYRYSGTKWIDVTTSIDTANNTIVANSVGPYAHFAVGTSVVLGTIILVQ